MTTTLQIEEGKFYRTRSGHLVGPMRTWPSGNLHGDGMGNATEWRTDGRYYYPAYPQYDIVEEVPNPAIEDDGFVTIAADPGVKSALAGEVPKEDMAAAEAVESRTETPDRLAPLREIIRNANPYEILTAPEGYSYADLKLASEQVHEENRYKAAMGAIDIKTIIADEAKRIVSGARRAAYGKPESNFERISAMWTAYAKAKGWPIEFTAGDVSPMMILMKIARVVESPAHYDSWVDIAGYCLTGAEVNAVSKPA